MRRPKDSFLTHWFWTAVTIAIGLVLFALLIGLVIILVTTSILFHVVGWLLLFLVVTLFFAAASYDWESYDWTTK